MCLIRVISLVNGLGLILVVLVFNLAISVTVNKHIRLVFCFLLSINNIFSIICVWFYLFHSPKFIIVQHGIRAVPPTLMMIAPPFHWFEFLVFFFFFGILVLVWFGFILATCCWSLGNVCCTLLCLYLEERAAWLDARKRKRKRKRKEKKKKRKPMGWSCPKDIWGEGYQWGGATLDFSFLNVTGLGSWVILVFVLLRHWVV